MSYLKSMTYRKQFSPFAQIVPWNIVRVLGGYPCHNSGKGVHVGVVDTGIDLEHPNLKVNVKGGINIVDPTSPPMDDNGHGTHVSGIIGASEKHFGIVGIAPAVSLYAIKVMDASGRGSLDDLLQGIAWGIRNKMDILNISITDESLVSPALVEVVETATKNGIFIIAAAGNTGNLSGKEDTVMSPACIPDVEAVAALDQNNHRCSFSATGPVIDIAAPGAHIFSTYPDHDYAVRSGTSMAAAHVTGVACIFRQHNPDASPWQIKNMLHQRMSPLPAQTRKELNGAGLVHL